MSEAEDDVRRVHAALKRVREATEVLHRAKFWAHPGRARDEAAREALQECLKHASSDFAARVQDVRLLCDVLDELVQSAEPGDERSTAADAVVAEGEADGTR